MDPVVPYNDLVINVAACQVFAKGAADHARYEHEKQYLYQQELQLYTNRRRHAEEKKVADDAGRGTTWFIRGCK